MAQSKALITTQEDFTPKTLGERLGYIGTPLNPFIYHNFDEEPESEKPSPGTLDPAKHWRGSGYEFIDGMRGKAVQFKGNAETGYVFENWIYPQEANQGFMCSFYYKPDPADGNRQFTGLVTNRGDGFTTNKGIHISLNYLDLDCRVFDNNGGTITMRTDGSQVYPKWSVTPGKWHHFVLIYDPGYSRKWELFVDGTPRLWTASDLKIGGIERSITLGNFFNSASDTYPANGVMDEFMMFTGSWATKIDNILAYDRAIKAGRFLDYMSIPGSLTVPRLPDGSFPSLSLTWESDVINLEEPIGYYGRVHANIDYGAYTNYVYIYTRSSDDGINFDQWKRTAEDGRILSPNKQYLQIKLELINNSSNYRIEVKELEILEYFEPKQYDLVTEPLRVYADIETGLKSMGILNRAYDIEIEEEIKSKDILTFKLPLDDPKRRMLGADAVEFLIRLGTRRYILKENGDSKGGGKKISEFKAEAKWYELNDPKIPNYELVEATAEEHVRAILAQAVPGTAWEFGKNLSTVTKKRTIRGQWLSVLALLREVENTFGIELHFYYEEESDQDFIDIVDQLGKDKKIRFYFQKNIKEIKRHVSTYGLVTRLYLYGKGKLDITTVNNGLPYIENLEWVNKLRLRNKIRPEQYSNENYTIPENLKADGEEMLAILARPNFSYEMTLIDLSSRSGHEPESIELGDTVYPVDEELMITDLPSRIMRRKYKVRMPHQSEIELDQPKKELADAQVRSFEDQIQTLTETDPVTNADIQEMTVFNHLLNSRADDGEAKWIREQGAGIVATSEGGFSGENSFRIDANYNEKNVLSQEVFNLAHRTNYSISAMVYKEGNITSGADGFIGLRIRVRYKAENGEAPKEEVKLLKIPDVTDQER